MSLKKNSFILKFLLGTLLSLHLTSCYRKEIPYEPAITHEEVMWAVLPYAIDLQHDKKLFLEDSHISYDPYGTNIKKLHLTFSSQSIVEIREARDLLVDVVDGLIDSINNDPVIGLTISERPLSTDNLEVCFRFESYHGLYVDKRYVHWMTLQDNTSYFYAFDMTNEFNIWDYDSECWHERIEPFNLSRQIVMIQRVAEESYAERHQKPESTLSKDRYVDQVNAEKQEDIKTGRTATEL